ncbi:metalloprotease family M12A [Thraustotheca clavata]|uniref:Metalloprotease family M12A n=1 Tax=Thraustotheca clavata TaxID=74557 RepID=A0A1V9ZCL3_9STRA|nr:metalloprotease family M12A [Thraustotheca clavata]
MLFSQAYAIFFLCSFRLIFATNITDDHCYDASRDLTMRHGEIHYILGKPNAKHSIYRVCEDGQLKCREEDLILDQPTLPDIDCDDAVAQNKKYFKQGNLRGLGLMVRPEHIDIWPQNVICYQVHQGFESQYLKYIDASVLEFQENTNIRLITTKQCKSLPRHYNLCGKCENYVDVNYDQPGCFALVGYGERPKQIMNLHADCFQDGEPGHAMHEFGHAAGLFHEHAHPHRKIIIIPRELTVSRNNYITSIMHYGASGGVCLPKDMTARFCDIDENESTGCRVPKQDDCDTEKTKKLGQRRALSAKDIESLHVLYPKKSKAVKAIDKKFAKKNRRKAQYLLKDGQASGSTSTDDDD